MAKDVAAILGFTLANLTYHYSRNLDENERGSVKLNTRGGKQTLRIISESGLYKLVMRSDKPEAKPFQDWVTKVVLPAIRKDGMYVMEAPNGLHRNY